MTDQTLIKMFRYLDVLRETGVTNMYGAGAYLERGFDLDRVEAMKITLAWMHTFSKDESPEARAATAERSTLSDLKCLGYGM